MAQNSGKHYTYNDYFIIKVTNEQSERGILRCGKVWKGPGCRASIPSLGSAPAQHISVFTSRADFQALLLSVTIYVLLHRPA